MLTELFCRGRDEQQRTFYVEVPDVLDSWPLRVKVHRQNPPRPAEDDWFSLTLDRFRDGLIVVEVNHFGKEWYAQKGIGDALLPEMSALTGLRIYSSSNEHKEYPNEFRSIPAGNIWLRLLQEELVSYLPAEDRFTFPRLAGDAASAAVDSRELSSASLARPATETARPPKLLPVFPDILPNSCTVSYFRPIQDDDVTSKEDLDELMWVLYDDPNCATYVYHRHDAPMNELFREAERSGKLDLSHTEYYYYKHPFAKSRRDYLQISPASLETTPAKDSLERALEWKKAIVAVGPMYAQTTLHLTPRMQRYFEAREAAEIHRSTEDDNPLELKPNFAGIGVDLAKAWKWLRKRFRSRDDTGAE